MIPKFAPILLASFLTTSCTVANLNRPTHAPGPMMAGHMQTMQQQMQQIHASKDPAERKRLMDEHMRSMQGMSSMMSRMGGPASPDPDQRMQMMEMRMDMMHKMMEQMLQHDAAEHMGN